LSEQEDDTGLEIRVRKRRRMRPPFPIPETITEELRDTVFPSERRSVLLNGCRYVRVRFDKCRFGHFGSFGSSFEDCDFRGARFGNGVFGTGTVNSVYLRCRFDGCDLRRIDSGWSRFEDCSFEGVKIKNWIAEPTELVGCRFSGTIENSLLTARSDVFGLNPGTRTRNEFRDNDFSGCELRGVSFEWGIDLSRQKLPRDPRHIYLDRYQERLANARAQVLRWTDLDARRDALEMLDFYSRSGYAEQESLYAERDAVTFVPKPVRDRVWQLLEQTPSHE
jgi:uncharacterized protein YjbI with pentapeptide repeats